MKLVNLVPMFATVIATTSISTPVLAAQPADMEEIKGIRETLLREDYAGFPISFGECISRELASRQGSKTKECRFLLETGQFPAEGYTRYSTCVRIYPETEFPPQ